MKILYLHGFEENRQSVKPAFIRKTYRNMLFPDLDMYLSKWNSPVRYGLASSIGLGGILTGVVTGMLSNAYVDGGGVLVGLAACLAVLFGAKEKIVRKGVQGSFDATKEIAKAAIEKHNPDLIVGFSWGGAVALDLVASKDFTGPLLLLSPAYHKLYSLMSQPLPSLSHNTAKIHIIHSKDDIVCPIDNSKELCNSVPFTSLQEVDFMGHRLWELCDTGDLIKGIEQLSPEKDEVKKGEEKK